MGERVYAWFEVGPFDRDMPGRSEAGAELVAAVDGYAADYEVAGGGREPDKDGTVRLGLCEVNYGTARFDEDDLRGLARAAGLFLRQGDEGGCEWSPSVEVFTPDGGTFVTCTLPDGEAVLVRGTYEGYVRLGGPVEERIAAHFALGSMSVAELAGAEKSGELDRLLALVGSKSEGEEGQ
jgi:hypothetical protein